MKLNCLKLTFIFLLALVGCVEPTVRNGTLLQHPSNKVSRVFVDTSDAKTHVLQNPWVQKVAPDFKAAIPKAFADYGVRAVALDMRNELSVQPTSDNDYLLVVKFMNGFTGSSGSGSNYSLDLFSVKNMAKVWSGSIFVSWTGSIMTENLGSVVANNIVKAMNSSKLFSDEIVRTNESPIKASSSDVNLTGKTLEAFEKFKTLQFPKAFALGDGGAYTYDSSQEAGQQSPAERALSRCEMKFMNCRIISDGHRIF